MVAAYLQNRLSLIVVTDPDCGEGRQVVEVVRAALWGGATAIQLRAKGATAREMVELGRLLQSDVRNAGALLFVNDRVDVALAIGADGAHVGDDDLPLSAARSIAPEGFLLGRSVDHVGEVRAAVAEGADYLGAGPVFPTGSKLDVGAVMGLAGLGEVTREARGLPVVGIGGIDLASAAAVAEAGAVGVAVIAAVMRAADPSAAAAALLRTVRSARMRRDSAGEPSDLQ